MYAWAQLRTCVRTPLKVAKLHDTPTLITGSDPLRASHSIRQESSPTLQNSWELQDNCNEVKTKWWNCKSQNPRFVINVVEYDLPSEIGNIPFWTKLHILHSIFMALEDTTRSNRRAFSILFHYCCPWSLRLVTWRVWGCCCYVVLYAPQNHRPIFPWKITTLTDKWQISQINISRLMLYKLKWAMQRWDHIRIIVRNN